MPRVICCGLDYMSSPKVIIQTHPNINKNLFAEKNIIGLKDDQTAYRLNTPTAVLKWRHQSDREDDIPIRVHCWPSVLPSLISYYLFCPS